MSSNKGAELLVITVLSLAVYVQAYTSSVNEVDDIRIEITEDDLWFCDMIKCPPETALCKVTKSNEKDPKILIRENVCLSDDDEVLASRTIKSPTNPKHKVRKYITTDRYGFMTMESDNFVGNFDEKKYNKFMSGTQKFGRANFGNYLGNVQSNLNNLMQSISSFTRNMNFGRW